MNSGRLGRRKSVDVAWGHRERRMRGNRIGELLGFRDVGRGEYGESTGAVSAAGSVEVVLCLTRSSLEVL